MSKVIPSLCVAGLEIQAYVPLLKGIVIYILEGFGICDNHIAGVECELGLDAWVE